MIAQLDPITTPNGSGLTGFELETERDFATAISMHSYSDPPTLLDACKVALIFHSGRTWDQDGHLWPPGYEATTKGLCDFVRAAIAAHEETESIHHGHELGGEA